MARTKSNTQNNVKHAEHQDATDIQNKTILCGQDTFERIEYNIK